MSALRVLLVEDEGLIRLMLADALEEEGFAVVEAVDGDQGVKLLEGCGGFHVLLTDVRMPGPIDGLHLAAYARARYPELPIVVVSGYAIDLERRLAGLDPPALFLGKPYKLEEVIAAVRRVVGPS